MKNRGQVTIFVILGLVILVVVSVLIYLSSSALRKEEPLKESIIEGEVSDVRLYVTSCLEESLKNSVRYCSGNFPGGGSKCPDYETDLANRVKEGFCNCIPQCTDFSTFKNTQVEVKGEIKIKASLTEDKKRITATMEYPILVKKDNSEHMLGMTESPFVAEYLLEQSSCVPIKIQDNDYNSCQADEDKTVEVLGVIFTFQKGDKVAIGDKCIAC